MTVPQAQQKRPLSLQLDADVLVIGGGLAGTWAALAAARAGARVVLADKGYCGTSGVTATAGPGHWWVPPQPELRQAAIAKRLDSAHGLADGRWMARIIDTTWTSLPGLAAYYDFPRNSQGAIQYRGLRGPEYLRAMRRLIEDSGVTIIDHSPALQLLRDDHGAIAGAHGWRRQAGGDWQVRAGAVVLATGGCAFMSRLLGSHTNTGDGYLLAAEAGAQLSGMEFSNYYCIAAAGSSMTRSMIYTFGDYFDAANRPLAISSGPQFTLDIGRALLDGPVYCRLNRVPQSVRALMPSVQPNLLLPFARRGLDPYRDKFAVTLHPEGTIRGVGGLRIVDDACQTSVPGLFAAGDAASRELIAGATSGGGAQNSAWALSSGQYAGAGAAYLALAQKSSRSSLQALGSVGLHSCANANSNPQVLLKRIQAQVHPLEKNLFREGTTLSRALTELDNVWDEVRTGLRVDPLNPLRSRELAAMAATARWCYGAAVQRKESRGMHQRSDVPEQNPTFEAHLRVSGVEQPQFWLEPLHNQSTTPPSAATP